MVKIKPFRGLRYNLNKIPDLSSVVSQPHDRIRPDLQAEYYRLSPHNIVRIVKGRAHPADNETDNIYTRAREIYQLWLREGILVREKVPALYVTRQTFTLPDGSVRTRQGLLAALELSPYVAGVVLPHEQTLPKSMADRISLLQATEANFGSVFMLYPGGGVNELLDQALTQSPLVEFRELFEHEVVQQLGVITSPAVIAAVMETLAAKPNLIIADGHHRYQTAVEYRVKMRARHPDAPPNAGFNYRLVTLVSMDDPGLVILPTHRLIRAGSPLRTEEILERAKTYFEITALPNRAALETALAAARRNSQPGFGLYNGAYALLSLRHPNVTAELLPDHSPEWRSLDVAVAHELFIERVLGIDKQAVAMKEKVEFIRNADRGFAAIEEGQADYLLLMNPTRIEQVRVCTAAGERMPQKSTDFYPKMLNGLVVLPVGAEEVL
ncbi:MAG: DUF1015 domain-containing protein [Anaerolineae bacterium]|nr:DUF1015 domain-containing protein [Anaerolineae bacterium]